MAPKIHCIRHGQGLHNLGAGFYDLPDPELTPEGKAQCLALRDELFLDQSHISLVAASPMVRAITSAVLIFQPTQHQPGISSKTILAIPDAQETSTDACDIGSDPEVLKVICDKNDWRVDLSLVKDGWNVKKVGGRYSPSSKFIARRARDVRLFLREQARKLAKAGDEDINIVLVAHGGFMHYFTEDWEGAETRPGTGWVNCETRTYVFRSDVDDDIDVEAHLVESLDSRRRRGLQHATLSAETQTILYKQAMQAWEDQGLQNHSKVGLQEEAGL